MSSKLNPGEKRKVPGFYYVEVVEEDIERNGGSPLISSLPDKRQRKPSKLLSEALPLLSIESSLSPLNASASSSSSSNTSSASSANPDSRFNSNVRATVLWPQEELDCLRNYLIDCASKKKRRDWGQYIKQHGSRKSASELSMKSYVMTSKTIHKRRNVAKKLQRDKGRQDSSDSESDSGEEDDIEEDEEQEEEEEEEEEEEVETEMKVDTLSNSPPANRPWSVYQQQFLPNDNIVSSLSVASTSSSKTLPVATSSGSQNLKITIPIIESERKPILPPTPSTSSLPSSTSPKSPKSQLVIKLKASPTSPASSTTISESKLSERIWSLSELIALEKAVTNFDSATRFARDWNTIALEFNRSSGSFTSSQEVRSASEIKAKWFTSHQDGRIEESNRRIESSSSSRSNVVDRTLITSEPKSSELATIDDEPTLRNRTPIIRRTPAPSSTYSRSPSLVPPTFINSSTSATATVTSRPLNSDVLTSTSSNLDSALSKAGEIESTISTASSEVELSTESEELSLVDSHFSTRRIIDDWDF